MAKKKDEDLTPDSDASATLGIDVPGELLADPDLQLPEEFQISADETEAEELINAEDEPVGGVDDPSQLSEAEQVAAMAASSRPVRKPKADVARKGQATPRQKRTTARERHRTTPAQFVRESVGELRKVVWPTGTQLRQYFSVVLLFVLIIIAFVGGLDLLFGQILLWLLG